MLVTIGRALGVVPPEALDVVVATAIISITLNPLAFTGIEPLTRRLGQIRRPSVRNRPTVGRRRLLVTRSGRARHRDRPRTNRTNRDAAAARERHLSYRCRAQYRTSFASCASRACPRCTATRVTPTRSSRPVSPTPPRSSSAAPTPARPASSSARDRSTRPHTSSCAARTCETFRLCGRPEPNRCLPVKAKSRWR